MKHRHTLKFAALLGLSCALAVSAFGQYGGGGGGGMGSSSPSYGTKSYGTNGAAIGAAAGAGAGAVAFLLIRHHRHATTAMVGCVSEDGRTFRTDKGNHSFAIAGESLTPGEHLAVTGKRTKNSASAPELEMPAVRKDLGQCQSSAGGAPGGGSD